LGNIATDCDNYKKFVLDKNCVEEINNCV